MARISDLVSITTPSSSMVLVVSDGQLSKKVTVADFKNTILTKATTSALGVVKVGAGLEIDDTGVLSVQDFNQYVLPIASPSLLGGVRIGSGLSISNDGILSVSYGNLPVSGSSTLGGVKVNNATPGLSVSGSGVLSVTFPTSYASLMSFGDPGVVIGNDSDLKLFVDSGLVPTIRNQVSGGILRLSINNNNTINSHVELVPTASGPNSVSSLVPNVVNSIEKIDLGSVSQPWGTVYATTYIGNFEGTALNADALRVEGQFNSVTYQAASVPATPDRIVARDGEGKIFAEGFIGNLSGTADQADRLKISNNVYAQTSVDVPNSGTASTVVVRNALGEINAAKFNGIASRAETVRLNQTTFVSPSVPTIADSIVVRDNVGDIFVRTVIGNLTGVASKADTLKVATNTYYEATETATINSIPVRNSSGEINATRFVGTATESETLKVGATSLLGTASAVANTVAVRNSQGSLVATSVSVESIVKTGSNGVGNIGQSNNKFSTVYATLFDGVATSAQFADLAEKYESDKVYDEGTVVIFGGTKEITESTMFKDHRVAGVISTKPAYLMNSESQGQAVALRGKVPVKVVGSVSKGDLLVTSGIPGHAVSARGDTTVGVAVFAKSIQDKKDAGHGVVMAVIL